MLSTRKLIEETVQLVERLNISLSDKLIQGLTESLSANTSGKSGTLDSDYCDLALSDEDISQLVDELFDSETDFAPKSLEARSEEEAHQAREASRIARIVNEWQALVTPSKD